MLGPWETLAPGQIEAELDQRAARAGTFHATTKLIRDAYLDRAYAERLRTCWSFWKVYYDKQDPNGLRKKTLYLCRESLCPYCGPFMHNIHRQDYIRRFQSLHPDGKSLDVIHLVFTVPDWMWPSILRRADRTPPGPQPVPAPPSVSPSSRGANDQEVPRRRHRASQTTPGLEAMKEAMKGALADLFCEGSKLQLLQTSAILCNLHVLGDDPRAWPTLKPHLDVVLAGHVLQAHELVRLPVRVPRARLSELPRSWASRLKVSMRPHMRTIEEHTALESMEWSMVKLAAGSKGQGIHRTEGHAWHTIDYSTRPMFCLKWAKLIGPDGTSKRNQPLDTLLYAPKLKRVRFLQDGTVRGSLPSMSVRVSAAPAMTTINGALGLMKGAHVHALMGTFNQNYRKTMQAIGRDPIPLHAEKSTTTWGLDRIIAKTPSGLYHDPGPVRHRTPTERS